MNQRGDWRLTEALNYEHGQGDPFAAAVRATRMPMVITDPRQPDNPIIFCNQAFQDVTGYERDEIIGRNCRFLQGPDTDPAVVARLRAAIDAGHDAEADLLNYRKDGSTFWNALYLSPVRDDAGELLFFFASQLNVTDRINAEQVAIARRQEIEQEVAARTADLQRALDAKTVLLHELDHRVKNNLAMVGSLLRLQSRAAADPDITKHLEDTVQRVDALGIVHRRLYQSSDITRFDVGVFLHSLAADLVKAANTTADPARIKLHADTQPVEIAANNASAIGLVINELLVNAIQHAFADGRAGTLSVQSRTEAGTALIDIADDGPDLTGNPASGLGLTLIDRLSRQVGVKANWTNLAPGTRVSLSFPVHTGKDGGTSP